MNRISILIVLFTVIAQAQPTTSRPSDASGHWEGNILIPGQPMRVRVDLTNDAGKWAGTIDIPSQSAYALTLDSITVNSQTISFRIADIPGEPTFNGALADGAIKGEFTQGPIAVPFELGREKLEGPKRPQDPVLPLPYLEEEVYFPSNFLKIAGTLTLPREGKDFPAAILISGSGPQNRDEELFDHRPFRIIADRLTRAGIAVLRYDDRGTNKSSGKFEDATTFDFADDALAAVTYLKSRKEVAHAKIGLVGHSEGGVIAPLAASRSTDVAFVIMLAGTGVDGGEILTRQLELIQTGSGATAEQVRAQLAAQKPLLDALRTGKSEAEIKPLIAELVKVQGRKTAMTAKDLESAVNATTKQLNTKWFRAFVKLDPRVALRKVKVPVLALNGEKDVQVAPSQNLPEIEKALKESGNKDFTTTELHGLNHLFQPAKTGLMSEYGRIETTFDESTLELMSDWINSRFGQR